MRTNLLTILVVLVVAAPIARADLFQAFLGFETVSEIGVSGLQSSYYSDTKINQPLSGATTGTSLAVLGPDRVTYPNGIGQVPSPGGSIGAQFDQGVLGIKIDGHNIVFQLATALNPQAGYYHSGWKSWYGQGDLFVDVTSGNGVEHFALLNTWGRDTAGNPLSLNGGYYGAAQEFHVGNNMNSSLEGHLVRLASDSDIALTGGTGAYHSGIAPNGLDLRTYAAGGTDLGDAGLTQTSVVDQNRTWYLQTWTIGLDDLSTAGTFDLGLHAAASCGNDQIGGTFAVPEPASLALVLAGALLHLRRRG
ncbi:MAG: PEP-CTERM sorting domain-containing protein [Phycisphaerae bacterium]|nr:PEP-CTERM sorting domain-containing protein [Phycisphaerae bacterium]